MLRAMSKSEPPDPSGVGATSEAPESAAHVARVAVESGPARRDVALPLGPTESGGVAVLRLRDDTLELGQLCEVRDGRPLVGELVRLEARADGSPLYDVEVLHDARTPSSPGAARTLPSTQASSAPTARRARKGPPKVTSEAYRDGWEQIFGARGSRGDGELN